MNSSLLNQLLSPILSTPASNRNYNNIRSNDDDDDASASSRFQRTVCVYDWWLVKVENDYEGKRLAVAGFTSREQQAMRVFTSAPIVKRHDVFTLETADEIYIIIKGFINKSRTMENGFSSEVFSHFMFGFPPYWEAYAEKVLGKEFMTGAGLFPDYNKAAADLEFAADAGMANPNSDAIPRNHKVNGKSKHNAGDINKCSEYVSENTSKSSDSPSHATDQYDIVNTKNHVSKNLLPSMSCGIGSVSSQEDNLAVQVVLGIPSSYPMTRYSERMANSKSRMKDNSGTAMKSKTEERASSEDVNMKNAAAVESPLPRGSDVENNNPFNLEPALSLGSSEVALRIASIGSKTSEKQKEIGKSKYGFNCENKNSPTASEPQDSDAIVRCIGEKSPGVESSNLLNVGPTMMHKEFLFASSFGGELSIPECVENHEDRTLFFSAVHSAVNLNTITRSPVDPNTVDTIGSNSGNKSSNCLRSLNSNQRRHSGFSDSFERARKTLMPEVSLPEDNLKRCSSCTTVHSGGKMDKLEETGNQSGGRNFRKLLENFKGKGKDRVSIEAIGSKISFVSVLPDETSNTVKNDNVCGEPLKPSHSTSVKVNSKPVKGCEKKSQARSPRQSQNNLAKCHSGLGDMDHNCNSKTTVGEGERNVKVGSSREKARKKINFDANASPHTSKTTGKSSVVSPESLSLKRSRSGRLLVPSLDFWRNQIAVYDADRKIIGFRKD